MFCPQLGREAKVFNLVHGLQKEIDDNADAAPVLQPLKDRAERVLKDLENRNTTRLAATDRGELNSTQAPGPVVSSAVVRCAATWQAIGKSQTGQVAMLLGPS
jgi:hypothetical protein